MEKGISKTISFQKQGLEVCLTRTHWSPGIYCCIFLYPGSGLWEGSGLIVDKSLLAVAHFLTQMHTGGWSTNMCSHFEGEF